MNLSKLIARTILGAFLGAILGVIAQKLFLDGPISASTRLTLHRYVDANAVKILDENLPVLVPMASTWLLAIVFCGLGGYEIRGLAGRLAFGGSGGALIGFVLGYLSYPPFRGLIASLLGRPFAGNETALSMMEGVCFGVPLGVSIGMFAVLLINHSRSTCGIEPSPHEQRT